MNYYDMNTQEVLSQLDTSMNGLTGGEAESRLSRYGKNEITERKKGDESHVVRHNHRTEIRNEYERENYIPHIFEFRYDFPCENFEKSDIRKSFHDKERSEKTTERGKIEIPLIFRVGRNEKHRRNGGNACKA